MQILIACAKLMDCDAAYPADITMTQPQFGRQAEAIALDMCGYDVAQLQDMLHVSHDIAVEVHHRYDNFFNTTAHLPAVYAYDGIVFKTLEPQTLSRADIEYAQQRLNICSFLYGLLRPLDAIAPYRLEGSVELAATGMQTVFDYWKPILTDSLIARVKADDGILINLASNEMQRLFDWKRVCREVSVISPEFKVDKLGRLSNITVYAKMCRGAMVRHILTNHPYTPAALQDFSHLGFTYVQSPIKSPLFVLKLT